MTKEIFQCQRTIDRAEAERCVLQMWEVMDYYEDAAKEELLTAILRKGFEAPDTILFDWERKRQPERFVLRARCLVEKSA